jgi:hypothetical protein
MQLIGLEQVSVYIERYELTSLTSYVNLQLIDFNQLAFCKKAIKDAFDD